MLGVTGDYLMEGIPEEAAKTRFKDRDLLQLFKEIEGLPAEDKLTVKKLLEAFLARDKIQKILDAG